MNDKGLLARFAQTPTSEVGDPTLLRDVAVDARPRVLQRPPSAPLPTPAADYAGAPADAVRPSAVPLTESTGYQHGVEQGHRDGLAAGQQEGRALGAQQGYQEGFEQGRQEGREAAGKWVREEQQAASRKVLECLASLDRLLDALPDQIAARLGAVEDDMVALCHQIVCRILGERLVTAEGVSSLVHQAIDLVHGETAHHARRKPLAAIHLHPRDLEKLQGDAGSMAWLAQRLATTTDAIPLVGDESVGVGGCLVHSPEGSLDARLATQMASLAGLLTREAGR